MSEGSPRIRFHLDENVDPDIAVALRRRGIDATSSQDARLLAHPDETQLDFARREGRMLVTHDDDFQVMANLTSDHCGIAYCHIHARSMRQITDALILIHGVLAPDDVRGHVEYL